MNPSLSIVIPVYRNASTLYQLHQLLTEVLSHEKYRYELIFVNDSCPGHSLPVLRELARKDPRTSVLALQKNAGQNQAVLTGLAHSAGEFSVVMDADLQDRPENIPLLLSSFQGDVMAVFAGRRGDYESPLRLLSSKLFKFFLHLLALKRVPADAGLFLAMKRPLVDRMLQIAGEQSYVIGLIAQAALPTISIPVKRGPNQSTPSNYSTKMRFQVAWRAVVTAWPYKKIRLSDENLARLKNNVQEYIGDKFQSNGT
ncbi:glycosyltransferase family 2 protein [Candidatus Pristimantibacillus sp. PTI5]|uniref:glycosyltransferase family 2 protein n=1 Tax=Candidatus Pristimantibacillus sp. PTI5 TaxID=3400422 RepID=UPI003B019CEF